jgi:hypothetical protein
MLIGRVICDSLQQEVGRGTTRKSAVSVALKEAGFDDCTVEVVYGEVHAYIGSVYDRLHGHVIVPIRKATVRYCRGYAMPRGSWNRYTY